MKKRFCRLLLVAMTLSLWGCAAKDEAKTATQAEPVKAGTVLALAKTEFEAVFAQYAD